MTTQLSLFNQYKKDISENYTASRDGIPQASTPKAWTSSDDQAFYRFSFKNRITAELESQLLECIVSNSDLTSEQQKRAEFYLNISRADLSRDARLGDTTIAAEAPVAVMGKDGVWNPLPKMQQDIQDLFSTPLHVAKIINWLSFLNLYRLIGTFSRLSWSSFWALAAKYQIIDDHNKIFGHEIDRAILNNSATVFNFLSVGLFAARFAAHMSMILKHAIVKRTHAEQGISPLELALHEFYIRAPNILNDLVWGIINLLTNYSQLWGISAALANQLTIVTLVFDFSWIIGQWYLKERELSAKHGELMAFHKSLEAVDSDDIAISSYKLMALKDMQLEVRALYLFQIFACLSIISGYLAVLTFSSAAVAPIGFLACVIGFGMYAGCGDFAAFIRASYGHFQSSPETQQALGSKFVVTVAKSAMIPALLVGVFTFNFPVAVIATLLYVAIDRYGPSRKPVVVEVDSVDDEEPGMGARP